MKTPAGSGLTPFTPASSGTILGRMASPRDRGLLSTSLLPLVLLLSPEGWAGTNPRKKKN